MSGSRRGRFVPVLVALVALVLAGTAATADTLVEKVKEFELDNGMKFLVVERPEAPVVFCAVVFNVGSANEWPNVTGISHLLEHMMFKGTKMIGTTDYDSEIPYIEKTDELGERTIELRKQLGEWRFGVFKGFSRDVLATFTDEENEALGASKAAQNALLVEKVRAMERMPDSLAAMKYLLADGDTDYLALYLEYEEAWGEIHRLLDEQRRFMVKDELWETYMNNGARFLNAGTSYDFTVYFAYLPANRLELWLDLESDRMAEPVFREFWSERDVVMEERRLSENDPDEMLEEAFYSVAFTACPYKWPVVGWMSDLLTIDRKELTAYNRRFYAPNNATVVLVGDIDYKRAKKLARRYFGPIPAQEPTTPVETREPEQQGERRVVIEHTANPRLMLAWHKPSHPDPDEVVFDVITEILASGRTSRLYTSIYEKQELTADPPNCSTGPGNRYDNLVIVSAEPRAPHTIEEVEAAIVAEIDRLKTEPVTERELQRIKNQIDAQTIRQLGSNLGIAFQVLFGELYLGDYRKIFDRYERIKEVTAEDVMRVAGTYFTERNRTVGWRVKVEEDADAAGGGEPEVDMQAIQAYVMSLDQAERMEIMQRFQSLRSDEERQALGLELYERAKAAGFVQDDDGGAEKGESK
ncbi:MAG: insulinase family protein [Candidatus Krumholzibacteriota bacterium]|nr:insulinase family protein [Candidatus Krumholzibacteriota bacterium]